MLIQISNEEVKVGDFVKLGKMKDNDLTNLSKLYEEKMGLIRIKAISGGVIFLDYTEQQKELLIEIRESIKEGRYKERIKEAFSEHPEIILI